MLTFDCYIKKEPIEGSKRKLFTTLIFIILIFIFIEGLILILLKDAFHDIDYRNSLLGRLGILALILSIYTWKKTNGEYFCAYTTYLVVSYLFMYGQCFLWAAGIQAENDLIYKFGSQKILNAQFFTLIGLVFFHMGAIYVTKKKRYIDFLEEIKRVRYSKRFYLNICKKLGYLFLAVGLGPFIIIFVEKIRTASIYGYSSLYDMNIVPTRGAAFISVLSLFIIPSLFCLMIGNSMNRIKRTIIISSMMIIIAMYLFIGARFEGYSLLVCSILYWNYFVRRIEKKQLIIFFIIILFLLQLIPVIRDYRIEPYRNIFDFSKLIVKSQPDQNNIVRAISELGGSMFPLIATMEIVPFQYPYRLGKTYIYSFFTLVPNAGFWERHPGWIEANVNDWLQHVLGLSYGPGYSMIAESYLNFGWLCHIFLFFLGGLFGGVLNLLNVEFVKRRPIICVMVFVFLFFSIITVRNSFVANIRALFYYTLPIYLVAGIISKKVRINNVFRN